MGLCKFYLLATCDMYASNGDDEFLSDLIYQRVHFIRSKLIYFILPDL